MLPYCFYEPILLLPGRPVNHPLDSEKNWTKLYDEAFPASWRRITLRELS
jgi:hypothetical protein